MIKESLDQALKVMIIDRMPAGSSRVPNKLKYYFSPHGMLPP
jgi:hypothetical protein